MQKNAVMYAMAGGRQSNMFASLMEGFAEDGGAELDRLMGLTEDSEGATQSKYEIAVSGINGAIEELKSTWDSLVATVTENGFLQGLIEHATQFVGALKEVAKAGLAIPTIITAITTAIGLMVAKMAVAAVVKNYLTGDAATASMKTAMMIGAATAVIGGIGLIGTTAYYGNASRSAYARENAETDEERYGKAASYYQNRVDRGQRALNVLSNIRAKYAGGDYTQLTPEEKAAIASSYGSLR